MVVAKREPDGGAFEAMMHREIAAQQWDINTPYPVAEYLMDLQAIAVAKGQNSEVSTKWRNPQSGHVHVASCPADHLYLRTYRTLMDRHGDHKGGGRGLRACAMVAFFNRCRERLDATALNWLDARQGDTERKYMFLKFLLHYPVPPEKQFSPEAIPTEAVDEFLAAESCQ